jgi:hypothetical protein
MAAAECAEDMDAPAPPDLKLAWKVERWGAAAVWGGEIPARILYRMNVCANVYAAVQSYQAGSNRLADWARVNPVYSRIVHDIWKLKNGAT